MGWCLYGWGMKRICALGLLWLGCAHERRDMAATAIGCPEENTVLVAQGDERSLRHPREPSTQETAMNAGSAALGALANAVAGVTPPSATAYYLPANSVMLMAPGWRQYDGCNKAIVCFDGGFCMKAEDADAVALARQVPALMERSAAAEPQIAGCAEPAIAERRGLLTWGLARCDHFTLCTAEKGGAFACNGQQQAGR
jgi:hypothetical protein